MENFEPAMNQHQDHQIGHERLQQIREGIHHLKDLCNTHSADDEPEDTMLLETMGEVLDSLERTFLHHFDTERGHAVSPKSKEPWD